MLRCTDSRLARYVDRLPPRLSFASLPTPVEPLPWIEGASVWIKRDDQSSSLYGGGKVRKLEWILGEQERRPILSMGATGSHHLLALALYLKQLDRTLHALVFPQAVDEKVRTQMAAMASLGTRFWPCRSRLGIPWALASYYSWKAPPERGRFVTAGGSDALGCLGFVEAGLELAWQIETGQCPRPGRIYLAAGSAGSGAGLAIGLALAGQPCRLHLVSAVEAIGFNAWRFHSMLKMVLRSLQRLGLSRDYPRTARALLERAGIEWMIDHRQVGPGYTRETQSGRDAMRRCAEWGLELEPTYTAKCFAALLADVEVGIDPKEGPVFFWNTHGANAVSEHIREGWWDGLPSRLQAALPEKSAE